MKYIKYLNINFNDWDEYKDNDNIYSLHNNTIKLGDKLHCYRKMYRSGGYILFKIGKWYTVKKDDNGDLIIITDTNENFPVDNLYLIKNFFDKIKRL